MNTRRAIVLTAPIAATLAITALFAGPLNPPGGAVTSTYKTLDQVEPRTPITSGLVASTITLSTPGSYYLTGNISYSGTGPAILVGAPNVTIDLCGFNISSTGTTGNTHGISNTGTGNKNTVVRNGSITGFAGNGVNIAGGDTHRVENIHVSGCTGTGIVLSTIYGSVNNCKVSYNLGGGITTLSTSTICDNTVDNNGNQATFTGDGINAGQTSLVARNKLYNNFGAGITASFGTTVSENNVRNCFQSGIAVNFDCQVLNNTIVQCNNNNTLGQAGILVSNRCDVRGNTLSICNRSGIQIGGLASVVTGNTVLSMGTGNLVGGLNFTSSGSVYQNNKVSGGIVFGVGVTAINDGGNTSF